MSSIEPPAGSTPPPGEPTPPPPPAADYGTASPQPTDPGTYAPPPPAGSAVGQPGGLLDRFLAKLIDGIIIGIVAGIIVAILTAAVDSGYVTILVSSIVDAVLFLGYFSYLESSRGQTIGKQVMKLRVFGPDGKSNPTMEQAVRRNIWTALAILGVLGSIGRYIGGVAELVAVIVIAVGINSDARRQHWFDKFAGGTQVLKVG